MVINDLRDWKASLPHVRAFAQTSADFYLLQNRWRFPLAFVSVVSFQSGASFGLPPSSARHTEATTTNTEIYAFLY